LAGFPINGDRAAINSLIDFLIVRAVPAMLNIREPVSRVIQGVDGCRSQKMRQTVIGVMGGGKVSPEVTAMAFELGRLIAAKGWVLLNGGRNVGVMDASARGAHSAGGVVIGVLPGHDRSAASPAVDYAIVTGMGDARNLINVLSSDVVVACPGTAGTLSEVALALKNGRPVIELGWNVGTAFEPYRKDGALLPADTPEQAVKIVVKLLHQ